VLTDAFAYRTLNDLPGAPHVVEDADTFAGNAAKKSTELARWLADEPQALSQIGIGSPIFCLADDSGLEVDALQVAPGVHSARFAALDTGQPGNSLDTANNAKLLRALASVPPELRRARFRCVIALTRVPQPADSPRAAWGLSPLLFEGTCSGHILQEARGQGGFGYDPLFVPDGFTQSFAELGDEPKNQMSHRARALEKLRRWMLEEKPA
jgi:XTP/dITP diphosphohydrolase